MVSLYAAMGVMMLTGIMAIFEMGMSLTGQSLLPNPPEKYDNNMKLLDIRLLSDISKNDFDDAVNDPLIGLCSALNGIEPGWSPITGSGYWSGGCQLTIEPDRPGDPTHSIIVRKNTHQLLSCALVDGESKCSFEIK